MFNILKKKAKEEQLRNIAVEERIAKYWNEQDKEKVRNEIINVNETIIKLYDEITVIGSVLAGSYALIEHNGYFDTFPLPTTNLKEVEDILNILGLSKYIEVNQDDDDDVYLSLNFLKYDEDELDKAHNFLLSKENAHWFAEGRYLFFKRQFKLIKQNMVESDKLNQELQRLEN